MSYAKITKQNALPLSKQPHPDPSLLQTSSNTSSTSSNSTESLLGTSEEELGSVSDKVNVVSPEEAEILRAVLNSDETETDHLKERFEAAKVETRKVAGEVRIPSKPSPKPSSSSASTSNGNNTSAKASGSGTTSNREKVETFAKKVEKKSEELKKEVREQSKKVEKKGRELERDAVAKAKKYPIAASGLVGLVNLTILASVGVVAYQNWNQPKWDRKNVSLISIGLLSIFGAESYLGYYEYEKEVEGDKKKSLPRV